MPDFADNYLGYLLARCSYEVSAKFHQKLKEEGVPVLSWRVLACVREAPETVNDLAKKVLVNQSTLSKALDRMERDHLITRARDPEFRSKMNITISPNGVQLIDRLIVFANDLEDHSFSNMNEAEIRELRRLLNLLLTS